MLRYISVFLLCVVGVYAGTCNTDVPPTVTLFVNEQLYTGGGINVVRGTAPCTYGIVGEATGPGYRVAFNRGSVAEDPAVDFGLEFSSFDDGGGANLQSLAPGGGSQNAVSDLFIQLTIHSNYSGGPFDNLNFFSGGLLLNTGGGTAFVDNFGSPIQQFFLDGNTTPEAAGNFGCFTDQSACETGGSNLLAPGPLSIGQEGGTMDLLISFRLSGGDTFILNGGSTLESVPEPATLTLIGVGLLSLAALARSRRRKS